MRASLTNPLDIKNLFKLYHGIDQGISLLMCIETGCIWRKASMNKHTQLCSEEHKLFHGGLGNRRGLAELFHPWALCEWHLNCLTRAGVLFDHALRWTEAGEDGSTLRSFILYSIARLEYYRGELHLAQHCVGLCLKEN